MAQKKRHKIASALEHLREALEFYDGDGKQGDVAFLAVAKAFEVAVEYAWKELKKRVENEGLETTSPKDAVRQAARMGIVGEAEIWLDYINTRNNSVHDYFGLPEEHYLKLARSFLHDCFKLTPTDK